MGDWFTDLQEDWRRALNQPCFEQPTQPFFNQYKLTTATPKPDDTYLDNDRLYIAGLAMVRAEREWKKAQIELYIVEGSPHEPNQVNEDKARARWIIDRDRAKDKYAKACRTYQAILEEESK